MKRLLLLLLILGSMFAIGIVQAQDETLTSADIDRIASYVVYIEALDRRGDPFASGSGTIMNETGTIYTNRHVTEDGDDFAIFLLDDMRELPVLSYFASIEYESDEIDFAILQIDRDEDGDDLDPDDLDLPFIEESTSEVNFGEAIYIFGFPDIGDGYLVLTQGNITTIENGEIHGDRLPVWYRTDAEMSSGNSGGLVVNGRGQYVGIPTWVRKADSTLGQLGGILPVPAIDAVLGDTRNNGGGNDERDLVSVTLVNDSNDSICAVYFSLTTSTEWGSNYLEDDEELEPGDDIELEVESGTYDMRLDNCDRNPDTIGDERDIVVEGETEIVYDRSGIQAETTQEDDIEQELIVEIQNIEYDVALEDGDPDEEGLMIYTYIRATGYRGEDLRVAMFYYWEDGEPMTGENAIDDNQSPSGYLTVQTVLTPEYDDTEWDGFWFWMPYDAFPDFRGSKAEGFAQAEIGLDGVEFAAFSNEEHFTLSD